MQYEKRVKTCQPENAIQVDGGWWRAALDFVLPPRCVLCGGPSGAVCICTGCRADLPWHGPHCLRCGLPLGSASDRTCGACVRKPPPFTRTVYPLLYDFPADRLVQAFKFKRQLAAGRVLSHLLCEAVTRLDVALPDMLIPVPLHRWRMFTRGFNQAAEMAAYTGRIFQLQVRTSALRRRRNTPAQSGLSRKQRRRNLHGAFDWHGGGKPGRHVALVDDVMTTGATLTECARVLKRAGARRVDVWVAARAVRAGLR